MWPSRYQHQNNIRVNRSQMTLFHGFIDFSDNLSNVVKQIIFFAQIIRNIAHSLSLSSYCTSLYSLGQHIGRWCQCGT